MMRGSGRAPTERDRARMARQLLKPVRTHPRQLEIGRHLVESTLVAVYAPRRAGKSEGLGRIVGATAIRRSNYVVRLLADTLAGPSRNWLKRDGGGGLLKLLDELGLVRDRDFKLDLAAGSVRGIRFAWGSAILVHEVGTQGAIEKYRGVTANLWVLDEAQSMRLLENVLKELVYPTLADHGGGILLAGTPGRVLDTLYHRACTGQLQGWRGHTFSSVENPRFGPTVPKRWARLVATVIEPARAQYGLDDQDIVRLQGLTAHELELLFRDELEPSRAWVDGLDGDFRREILGHWVQGGADLVYPWFARPELERYYCQASRPERLIRGLGGAIDGLPVANTLAERVTLLPKHPPGQPLLRFEWLARLGFDLGFHSAASIVAFVWARYCPIAFELYSQDRTGLDSDEIFEWLGEVVEAGREAGLRWESIIGDINGTQLSTGKAWDRGLKRRMPRLGLSVRKARKPGKLQQMVGLGLNLAKMRFVAFSSLDVAGRHCRFKPAEPGKEREIDKARAYTLLNGDQLVPGDHALDAMRYGMIDCSHFAQVEPIPETPVVEKAYKYPEFR